MLRAPDEGKPASVVRGYEADRSAIRGASSKEGTSRYRRHEMQANARDEEQTGFDQSVVSVVVGENAQAFFAVKSA